MQSKKILLAIDFSIYSLPSLQYTHQLAKDLGAEIILVNVYHQRDMRTIQNTLNAYYDAQYCDRIIEDNLNMRREDFNTLIENAGAQTSVTQKIIRVGVPDQVIMDVIAEEKPDLLVICTKGRSNFADTIIGSCAQKMYRRSPIPMLSLRINANECPRNA